MHGCWLNGCIGEAANCHLPSEDQWEYAAKFGIGADNWHYRYWWGDRFNEQHDAAKLNCRESGHGKTLPASPERASPATRLRNGANGREDDGLMDMLGNVWEWCRDVYRRAYQFHAGDDPGDGSSVRVLRGGSFRNGADDTRCSIRSTDDPSYSYLNFGVRFARALPRRT